MEKAAGFGVGAVGEDGPVTLPGGELPGFAFGVVGVAGVGFLSRGKGNHAQGDTGPFPVAIEGVVDGGNHGRKMFEHVGGGLTIQEIAASASLTGEVDAELELFVELVDDLGFGIATTSEAKASHLGAGGEGECNDFGEVGPEIDVVFHDDAMLVTGLEEHFDSLEMAEEAGHLVGVGAFSVAADVAFFGVVGMGEFDRLTIDRRYDDEFEFRISKDSLATFATFLGSFEVDDKSFHFR